MRINVKPSGARTTTSAYLLSGLAAAGAADARVATLVDVRPVGAAA